MQGLIDVLSKEWFHLGDWRFSPLTLIRLVFLLFLAFVLAWVTRRFVRRVLVKNPHIDPTTAHAIVSSSYFVALALGLLAALNLAGVNVTSLAVFTGAVGVGVGLGLQDLARNFVAGVILVAGRPVRVGDLIELGTLSGTVLSIGGYSTVLQTQAGASIIVPNSSLLNDRVVNWSLSRAPRMVETSLRVQHTAKPDLVERALLQAAEGHPAVLKEPKPRVRIGEFNAGTVEVRLLAYTEELAAEPDRLRSDLARASWQGLEESKVPIAPGP